MKTSRTSLPLNAVSSGGTLNVSWIISSSEEDLASDADTQSRSIRGHLKARRRSSALLDKDFDLGRKESQLASKFSGTLKGSVSDTNERTARLRGYDLRESGFDTHYGRLTPELMKKILLILAQNNVPLKASQEETLTPRQLRQILRQSKIEKQSMKYHNPQHAHTYKQIEEHQRIWEKKMIKKMIERVAVEAHVPKQHIVRKSAMFVTVFKRNPNASLEYDEEYAKSVLKRLGIPNEELGFFKKLAVNLDGLSDLVEDFLEDYRPLHEHSKKMKSDEGLKTEEDIKEGSDVNDAVALPVARRDRRNHRKRKEVLKQLKETTPRRSLLKSALVLLMGENYDPQLVIRPYMPSEKDLERASGTNRLNTSGKLLKETLEKGVHKYDPSMPKTSIPNEWFMTARQKQKKAYYRKLNAPRRFDSKISVDNLKVVLPRDVIVDVLAKRKTKFQGQLTEPEFIGLVEKVEPLKLKHFGWTEKSRPTSPRVYTNKLGEFKKVIDSHEEVFMRKLTVSEYQAKYNISVPLHFVPRRSVPKWKRQSVRRKLTVAT